MSDTPSDEDIKVKIARSRPGRFAKDVNKITDACIASITAQGIEVDISKKAKEAFQKAAQERAQSSGDFDAINSLNDIRVEIIKSNRDINRKLASNKFLLLSRIRDFRALLKKHPNLKVTDTIQLFLDGLNKDFAGEGISISARQKFQIEANLAKFEKAVDNIKNMSYSQFRDDTNLQEEVADLFLKDDFRASDKAKEIKQALDEVYEDMRRQANANGADIGFLSTFFSHQVHDVEQLQAAAPTSLGNTKIWLRLLKKHKKNRQAARKEIREMAYKRWRDTILPLLNKTKTFEDVGIKSEDVEDVMRSIYGNILRGFKIVSDPADEEELIAQFGSASLGKRMSQHRFFHFTDGKSWGSYNNSYGNGSISRGIVNTIEGMSNKIGLLEKTGPNPNAFWDRMMRVAKAEAATRGEKMSGIAIKQRETVFRILKGVNNIPVDQTIANIGSFFRAIQSYSKLGRVLFSSLPDIATMAMNLHNNTGMGIFESFQKTLAPFFSAVARDDKNAYADLFATNAQLRMGMTANRFGANDSNLGTASRLTALFYKMTGLTWWDSFNKEGAAAMWGQALGQKSNVAFEDLPLRLRRTFNRFAIEKNEWDLMRRNAVTHNGKKFIGSTGSADVTTDAFKKYLVKIGKADASDAEKKSIAREADSGLSMLMRAQVDSSIMTPGATETAAITWGSERGTVTGELIRALMQYKIFTFTYGRKAIMPGLRRVFAGNDKANSARDLMTLFATSSMLGFGAIELKNATAGKRTPLTGDLAIRSMLQGGGVGFYADWLFGNYSKYGQSITGQLLGPSFGTIDQLARLGSAIARQNNPGSAARSLITGNTPLINMWYLNWAFNYGLMFSLSDWLDPGYVQRAQRRRIKNQTSSFVVSPSAALDPFGSLR